MLAELDALGLEPYHAEALDDDAFDDPIAASIAEALELVGPDVGIPIVAVTSESGRVGGFGPVLIEFPVGDSGPPVVGRARDDARDTGLHPAPTHTDPRA